jgi:hypothetical protein
VGNLILFLSLSLLFQSKNFFARLESSRSWQSWTGVRIDEFRVCIPIPWGNPFILDLGFITGNDQKKKKKLVEGMFSVRDDLTDNLNFFIGTLTN